MQYTSRGYGHVTVQIVISRSVWNLWLVAATSAAIPRQTFLRPRSMTTLQDVYTYNPEQFDMYNNCKNLVRALPNIAPLDNWNYSGPTHNMDVHFVRSMTSQMPYRTTLTADPSMAMLFVVPVYWTQSFNGKCGDHKQNVAQMHQVLSSSLWYTRNRGKDHVLVCDRFESCKELREEFFGMILGAFEKSIHPPYLHGQPLINGVVIPVGYTTVDSLGYCDGPSRPECFRVGHLLPVPMEEREHLITSIGQTNKDIFEHSYGTDPYVKRRALWCDWVDTDNRPERFLIKAYEKSCASQKEDTLLDESRYHFCRSFKFMRTSKMMFSFSGDTPTTDRIFNAFVSLTPIVVLSDEKPAIIDTLPAADVVPWSDILLEIDTRQFLEEPVKHLQRFVEQMGINRLKDVQHLMEENRKHVLWHVDGSEAPMHFLTAAKKSLQSGS